MKEKASDIDDYIAESRTKTSKHSVVIAAQRNEKKSPVQLNRPQKKPLNTKTKHEMEGLLKDLMLDSETAKVLRRLLRACTRHHSIPVYS